MVPGIINVAAVSFRPEISEMLQRYVGGILKDIAVVKALTPEEALGTKYDLYIVYTMGIVYRQLSKVIDMEKILIAELFPMPQGIRRVLLLPEGSRLGILGGHVWDAADLLGQIINVGVRNYLFSTGTPETAAAMDVDWYVLPEEIVPYIKEAHVRKKLVIIPRMLDSQSVARIISTALRIQKEKAK